MIERTIHGWVKEVTFLDQLHITCCVSLWYMNFIQRNTTEMISVGFQLTVNWCSWGAQAFRSIWLAADGLHLRLSVLGGWPWPSAETLGVSCILMSMVSTRQPKTVIVISVSKYHIMSICKVQSGKKILTLSFDIYLKKTYQTEADHCKQKLTSFLPESNATSWNQQVIPL